MKAVILAGGLGSRIAEETSVKPKPMIEIGGKPILWHIMKIYSHHGINDFIICCGYKGYVIKEYFSNYFLHMSDVTFDMSANTLEVHNRKAEPWRVTLVDTGEETMTGGRIKRISKYIENEDAFCMTYGDGVGDVNITELIAFHKLKGTLATLTATLPPGRFGALQVDNGKVLSVKEKPQGDGASINGGYFVLSPAVIELIPDDQTIWERGPALKKAALSGTDFHMTKGEQLRDFISVKDVARQFDAALDFSQINSGYPLIKHVATGKSQRLIEFANHCWKEWGARGRIINDKLPYRKDELMRITTSSNAI